MALLKFENWDSATPPALPAGWNSSGANIVTSIGVGSDQPYSLPNQIANTADTFTFDTLTWGTSASSADMIVTGLCNFGGHVGNALNNEYSLISRSNASTTSYSSSIFYEACMSAITGVASIFKNNAGTRTSLGATSTIVTFNVLEWYQLTFTTQGIFLGLTIQRLTDSEWLTGSGTWSNTMQSCISISDTTLVGYGDYAGLMMRNNNPSYGMFADDWSLSSVVAGSVPPWPPQVVYYPRQFYPQNAF
jgi:hypothetical protein